MKIKGKKTLKNGVLAGYILQKDGSWKWRFITGPSKKKRGGQNIKEGRLNKLIRERVNVNKNNPKIINKLKNLSLSLEQKHLASPKVFGKHDNKIYKKMYEDLQKIIKMKSSKNKAEYFLSNEIRKRINKSIEKWTVKKINCETRRCKKQRVASKLMEKDIKQINTLINSLRKSTDNSNNSSRANDNNVDNAKLFFIYLKNFYKCYFNCNDSEICCTAEKNKLLDNWFNVFCKKDKQCDSNEFLLFILNNIEKKYGKFLCNDKKSFNELKTCLNGNKIANLLSCIVRKKIIYKKNSEPDKINFKPEWNIKVDTDNNSTIEPYKISEHDEQGENALNVNQMKTQYCFSNNYVLLNYLIFDIKRDADGKAKLDSNGKVQFYKKNIKINNINKNIVNQDNEEYELLGIICHSGGKSINFGHYVAYVKRGNQVWYCSDKEINKSSFNKYTGGGTPYILLYKKKSHTIPELSKPKKLENGGNSYDNTCYANSALQLLFSIPEMCDILTSKKFVNRNQPRNANI